MKIEYEMDWQQMCLTDCPNIKDRNKNFQICVGAAACEECRFYQKKAIENGKRVLYCGFEEGR